MAHAQALEVRIPEIHSCRLGCLRGFADTGPTLSLDLVSEAGTGAADDIRKEMAMLIGLIVFDGHEGEVPQHEHVSGDVDAWLKALRVDSLASSQDSQGCKDILRFRAVNLGKFTDLLQAAVKQIGDLRMLAGEITRKQHEHSTQYQLISDLVKAKQEKIRKENWTEEYMANKCALSESWGEQARLRLKESLDELVASAVPLKEFATKVITQLYDFVEMAPLDDVKTAPPQDPAADLDMMRGLDAEFAALTFDDTREVPYHH